MVCFAFAEQIFIVTITVLLYFNTYLTDAFLWCAAYMYIICAPLYAMPIVFIVEDFRIFLSNQCLNEY